MAYNDGSHENERIEWCDNPNHRAGATRVIRTEDEMPVAYLQLCDACAWAYEKAKALYVVTKH